MIDIFYGADTTYINITDVVLNRCAYGDHIFIPANDAFRDGHFADPLYGVAKNILIVRDEDGGRICRGYDGATPVDLRLTPEEMRELGRTWYLSPPTPDSSVDDKIRHVHAQLQQFSGGHIAEEWSKQRLIASYLEPGAKVLEIGSHFGRNTLLMSGLLEDDRNLVALECDLRSVEMLGINRDGNNCHFAIEPSALSYRNLIQRGWDTIPSEQLIDGYQWVQTITYADLETKYSIEFDTLVLDCAGAIYYVLRDNPQILQKISTIILQSDYRSVEHKLWVDGLFGESGFHLQHSEPLLGREWLPEPDECQKSYYEVWKK